MVRLISQGNVRNVRHTPETAAESAPWTAVKTVIFTDSFDVSQFHPVY